MRETSSHSFLQMLATGLDKTELDSKLATIGKPSTNLFDSQDNVFQAAAYKTELIAKLNHSQPYTDY